MNLILSLPMQARLAVLFVFGGCIGSAVNLTIYRLAWHPRPISPWSRSEGSAPPRHFWDRIPVIGWLGLRREAGWHGAGFWIRPMCLELLCGLGYAALYWWEVGAAGLLLEKLPGPLSAELLAALNWEFALHAVLIALMLAASMIDIDEKVIPDAITIPGTLIGLLVAALWPRTALPVLSPDDVGFLHLGWLHLGSPNPWPDLLRGAPNTASLWLGLICWWLWCAAILPRTWYSRHGWFRAAALAWARVVREPATYRILRMAIVGSLAIAIVWYRNGDCPDFCGHRGAAGVERKWDCPL